MRFKLKKRLGQRLLSDNSIARSIVDALPTSSCENVLEIGPGIGALTKFLSLNNNINLKVVEIDPKIVELLKVNISDVDQKIIMADFLKLDLNKVYGKGMFSVIGNFPYNISSQILFKVIDYHHQIPNLVGMFQKEVANRIASKPGSKVYGILSVFTQLYYKVEILFEVPPAAFYPSPKVDSSVIRLVRHTNFELNCDKEILYTIIKTSFKQRRKTLKNSLKSLNLPDHIIKNEIFSKRPEELSPHKFIALTKKIERVRL